MKRIFALSLSVLLVCFFTGCEEEEGPELLWQANVVKFHFQGYENYPGTIQGTSIVVNLPSEAENDIKNLVPVVELSPGATVPAQFKTGKDFEVPVSFKVTAEDRQNQQVYTVLVNVQSGYTTSEKVVSYTMKDNTYPSIFTPNNNRTVAMTKDHVFVTATASGAGEIYWMPNAAGATFSEDKKLSKGTQGIIAGGTFALSTVRTSGDAIYASNLAIGGGHSFRVYKWTNKDDAEPELFINFPHNGENRRLGDAITVWGDLSTNGAIVAHDRNSGNTFYKFNVTNGVASSTPEVIVSNVGGIGSFGQMNKIDDNNYLITGSTVAPALVGPDGAVKHGIPPGVMPPGATVGATVFTYNKARYLATTVFNPALQNQKFIMYDITGKDLLATFQSINSNTINARKKVEIMLGEGVPNGNLTGSTDAILINGKARVAGLAPNSGLIIYDYMK